MYQSMRLEDNDATNHKIKALELNAQQFQAQMKPLFNENVKLKQNLISLNFFIEERKLQLSNLISDIGPSGEDRVLIKSVSDFQQICQLLEDELVHLNKVIKDNNDSKSYFQNSIKTLKEQLSNETERYLSEKQILIDKNRKLSVFYKQQQQQYEQKIEQQKMKIEDLHSQVMFVKLNEQNIHKSYKEEIDYKQTKFQNEINQLKFEKLDQQEKFEVERRSYLKQLETFSIKLNEAKTQIINEYEYKLQSQKLKLDNQIQKLREECQDYRSQSLVFLEKNKSLQQQIDRNTPYISSLEKETQDLKYKIFLLEEQLKGKEQKQIQQNTQIDILNDQIKKLKDQKGLVQNKDSQFQRRSTQVSNKVTSPDKIQKQQQQYRPSYVTKQREIIKQEQPMIPSQRQQQKEQYSFDDTTIEEYMENNKVEKHQSSMHQSQQSLTEDSNIQQQYQQQFQLIKIIQNDNNTSIYSGRKPSLINKSLQTTERIWIFQVEASTQTQQIIDIGQLSNSDVELMRLQEVLQLQQEEYEFKLKCKQDELTETQDSLKIQQIKYEQLLEQKDQELKQQLEETHLQKELEMQLLNEKLQEKINRLQGMIDSEQLYETLIEDLNEKIKKQEEEFDQQAKQNQEKIKMIEQQAQNDQMRLLQLNEQQKEQHQSEIENLYNQHILDQEQLVQEKQKLNEERIEHSIYVKQTNNLLDQAQSKEHLLDSYRKELLKTNEIVKYLSLEIENFKKINNIFRSKNENPINSSFLYNGMGFLPTEVQDKIKQRMSKAKQKNTVSSYISRDAYAMNFSLQKGQKMKSAKLVAMNGSVLDQKNVQKNEAKFRLEGLGELNDISLPKVTSKNLLVNTSQQELSNSDQKQKQQNRNIRSKTQQEDYVETSDPLRMIQDINQKELLLIQRSQMLLSQLNVTSENIDGKKQQKHKSNYKI